MNKLSLSLALCAALSFTVATAMPTPAEAAKAKSSKSSKSKATKVTVSKSGNTPTSVTYFHNCAAVGAGWGILAPVAAVGCGAVWAVPVIVQSLLWRA